MILKLDNINTILVTGGAGYVGNVLVPLLLESNYKVIVYDAMFFYDDTLPNNNNLQIIKGDIKSVIKHLKTAMLRFSEKMEFEKAQSVKEKLNLLETFL